MSYKATYLHCSTLVDTVLGAPINILRDESERDSSKRIGETKSVEMNEYKMNSPYIASSTESPKAGRN